MDTIKLIALLDLQFGLLLFGMSLPLMLRKVPMNRWYGIRIPAAFDSEQGWYDVNAYGGRQLAIWSWPLIFAGATGFFVSPVDFVFYVGGSIMATLLVISLPLLMIARWLRRR
jgi:hypothetical protein